jgi:signal peptidase I
MRKKRKPLWREWTESIIIALVLAVFVRIFFFELYKIPTTSMVPTLIPGDRILVSKCIYGPRIPFVGVRIPGYRKIRRGEVIVFIAPDDRSKSYVKRVVGLPGEEIEIRRGNIFIDGEILSSSLEISSNFYYNRGEYAREGESITIPEAAYFVLGDNSSFSKDSRFWGVVPQENILGKSILIWWPLDRFGLID